MKLLFRILILGLGLFICYYFGKDAVLPAWYRATGTTVEGRISGFVAGRGKGSVQPEATGVRNGKRRNRKLVFRYPVAVAATDSLEARSLNGGLGILGNMDLHERVTVVFPKNKPAEAYILSGSVMLTSVLLFLFGLFMVRMGLTGKA